jgi:asparagine synthase (glutamine-hydrolysing)
LLEYGGSYAEAYFLRRALFLPFELDTMLDRQFVATGLRRLKPVALASANGLNPMPRPKAARVAALESTNYMRNQLLRDADWAGMAHGVEVRVPLVDFMLLQTLRGSAANGRGKALLARAPSLPLPDHVLNRSKTGFLVPTERLLSGVLTPSRALNKGQLSRQWSRRIAEHFRLPGSKEADRVASVASTKEQHVEPKASMSRN